MSTLTNDLARLANNANVLVTAITTNATAITSVNVAGFVINSTGYNGNANNASYLGGTDLSTLQGQITSNASAAYTNAVSYTDGKILTANSAITGNAATAYTNAVSYTDGKILTANSAITGNASTAYTNATIFASNASNINTGTLAETRLPYRMNQNVTTTNNVTFGDLTLTGNLYVGSNVNVIGSNNLSIVDNMIYLNANNTVANPDLGIAANYNDGTYAHTGIFRDASDAGTWKVFDNYLPEPDANTYIDTSNTSFHLANFQANTLNAGNTSTNWFIANTAGVYATGTVNAASHTVGTSTIANSAGVYTGVVNAATIQVGSSIVANSSKLVLGTAVGLQANGSIGSNGQVLTSNATTVYWANATAGATGGGSDKAFWENDITITTDYTISTNKNAMTAGPVSVNSNVTVTIPSGSTWTVV